MSKNKGETLHCPLVTDQNSWVWTTQTRSSLGFGRLDFESVQNVIHMSSKTELVLQVNERQYLIILYIYKFEGVVSLQGRRG